MPAYHPPADDPIRVPVGEIETDPARLQFRPHDGADGLNPARRTLDPFDPDKAPPLGLWLDPDGYRLLVVDGHKRLTAAKQSGAAHVHGHLIDAPDAAAAREIGRGLNAADDDLPDRVFAASQPRRDGEVWQGPSGHWFTKKNGHVVPAKAPGGDNPVPSATPSTPAPTVAAPPSADTTRAAVAASVPAGTPPGVVSRLADKAVTAAAKVHLALTRLTPAMHKALEVMGAVFDTPDDFRKFGYNPGSSGVGTGDTAAAGDPLKSSLGVSSHVAATIAAKVIGAGLVHLRKATGVKLYADEADGLAVAMHEAFTAVAAEFELAPPPDVEVIAEHIRAAGGAA